MQTQKVARSLASQMGYLLPGSNLVRIIVDSVADNVQESASG